MRVLFSCTATEGHVAPLVPLARAFADLGHDVAFATAPAFEERIRSDGFETLAAGLDQSQIGERMQEYRPRLLEAPEAERRPVAYTSRFAQVEAPTKLPGLLRAAEDWRPGLLVHDASELAAPPVAASLGIPSVNQGFGQVIPAACHERAAEVVRALWEEVGLAPEPWNGMYRGAYVDICPPSLAGETVPGGTPMYPRRPATPSRTALQPPWQPVWPDLPNVYVTLGTVLDEADVLPHCSAVVSHGGSGTTYGALAHGLPLLLLPHGADQFENAVVARTAGVAEVLMPHEIEPTAVRSAVEALFAEPSFAARAVEIAAEIAAMPEPVAVAAALAESL